MTSVIGHLNGLDFDQQYRKWQSCHPRQLFDAPVYETVDRVCVDKQSIMRCQTLQIYRIRSLLQRISRNKPDMQRLSSSGLTAIERESTLVLRFGRQP